MDIFQRRTTFGGGFNALTAKVIFSGFKAGMAFESVNFQYQQQLVRLWDLDGDAGNTYLVAGHPQGAANVGKAIGPRSISTAFYERYGDVCRATENNLSISANVGCVTKAGGLAVFGGVLTINLTAVVISSVSVQITANEPVMRQAMAMSFVSLDWDESGGNQAIPAGAAA